MANTIKMSTIFALLLCIACTVYASPLYKTPSRLNKYALLLDPLEAAASDEVPMVHNNNYDTLLIDDDQNPEESMHYQNFEFFHEPTMDDNSEYKMDETQFLPKKTPPRAPQPLTAEERQIRQLVEQADPKLEYKKQQKLKKGSTAPRGSEAAPWEQFDYDLYSVKPGNTKQKF